MEVGYIGCVLSEEGTALTEFSLPRQSCFSYVGLPSYFIPHFARIAGPLHTVKIIPYIGNHPWKNKFTDFAKFGSFTNVFLLLFSVC